MLEKQKFPRRISIGFARKDVPPNRAVVLPLRRENLFGKQSKEWFPRHWTGRKGSLGSVPTQPCALTTSDRKGRHLACCDDRFAARHGRLSIDQGRCRRGSVWIRRHAACWGKGFVAGL